MSTPEERKQYLEEVIQESIEKRKTKSTCRLSLELTPRQYAILKIMLPGTGLIKPLFQAIMDDLAQVFIDSFINDDDVSFKALVSLIISRRIKMSAAYIKKDAEESSRHEPRTV